MSELQKNNAEAEVEVEATDSKEAEAKANPEAEAVESVPVAPKAGTAKEGTAKDKLIELSTVTRELKRLVRQSEAIDMAKAERLAYVKDNELYALRNWTWSQYCQDVVGVHMTTVGRLLRCYRNKQTREAYTTLGKMRSFHIATMAKNLDGHMEPGAIKNQVAKAIEHAKVNTTSDVKEHTQSIVKEATEAEAGTLESLVERAKELRAERDSLTERIAGLQERLTEVNAELESVNSKLDNAESD